MRSRSRLDAVTGVVGDAAGALRRRREARRPYAKLYAADGDTWLLDPAGEQAGDLLDTAASMVDAAAPDPPGGRTEGE
jgi:hypothetical protein